MPDRCRRAYISRKQISPHVDLVKHGRFSLTALCLPFSAIKEKTPSVLHLDIKRPPLPLVRRFKAQKKDLAGIPKPYAEFCTGYGFKAQKKDLAGIPARSLNVCYMPFVSLSRSRLLMRFNTLFSASINSNAAASVALVPV